MSRAAAVILTLAAGGFVALQPPANALLARHVGDVGATFVSLAVSFALIGAVLIILGDPARLSGAVPFKPEYAIGGLGGAAVVGVSLAAVRPLGAGALTALLVAAQLIVAVIADRMQWFGLHHVALSPARLAGLALVIAGTVLVTRT